MRISEHMLNHDQRGSGRGSVITSRSVLVAAWVVGSKAATVRYFLDNAQLPYFNALFAL